MIKKPNLDMELPFYHSSFSFSVVPFLLCCRALNVMQTSGITSYFIWHGMLQTWTSPPTGYKIHTPCPEAAAYPIAPQKLSPSIMPCHTFVHPFCCRIVHIPMRNNLIPFAAISVIQYPGDKQKCTTWPHNPIGLLIPPITLKQSAG